MVEKSCVVSNSQPQRWGDKGQGIAFRGSPTAACYPQAPPSNDAFDIYSSVGSFIDEVSALVIQSPLSSTSIRRPSLWWTPQSCRARWLSGHSPPSLAPDLPPAAPFVTVHSPTTIVKPLLVTSASRTRSQEELLKGLGNFLEMHRSTCALFVIIISFWRNTCLHIWNRSLISLRGRLVF